MSFNDITSPVYYLAIRLMFSRKSVTEGMRKLDSFIRNHLPHPFWDKLRDILREDEISHLLEWVKKELQSHQENIPILYFGLSDMGDILSLSFLQQMRQANHDHDWGAYSYDVYSDAPSRVLKQMYEIAESELTIGEGEHTNHEVRWIVETCYPLAYAGLVVGEIVRNLPTDILIGNDAIRRVAVFFDEGDDFFLGEITKLGFKYYEIPEFVT